MANPITTPQRYETFQGSLEDGQSIMVKDEDGGYILYEDHVVALNARPQSGLSEGDRKNLEEAIATAMKRFSRTCPCKDCAAVIKCCDAIRSVLDSSPTEAE